MFRGEIRMVEFSPARQDEVNKRRPAVVVSSDVVNRTAARLGRGVVTVVPVSSSVARVFPFQVEIPSEGSGLKRTSKAQPEQVRAVSYSRVGRSVGRVPLDLMRDLDDALRIHLAL